jgi:hypothetical protein
VATKIKGQDGGTTAVEVLGDGGNPGLAGGSGEAVS